MEGFLFLRFACAQGRATTLAGIVFSWTHTDLATAAVPTCTTDTASDFVVYGLHHSSVMGRSTQNRCPDFKAVLRWVIDRAGECDHYLKLLKGRLSRFLA
jgi:hypothetical protein